MKAQNKPHGRPSTLLRTSTLLLAVFLVITGQAFAQITYEDFEIIPDDAAAGDQFGLAVDIDDGIIAAGAAFHQDNGWRSGTAYLFDATTGTQLWELLPESDNMVDAEFGASIALDNGLVAVGAPTADSPSYNQMGAVYIFDATTGEELSRLVPNDPANFKSFGWPLAMADGLIAISAQNTHENGDYSGSAYLFDAQTGNQLFKLLADDGIDYHGFGRSIAVGDGIVAVGAYRDNDLFSKAGSVYIFDAETGEQISEIYAGDADSHDEFGNAVAIGNGILAVGAHNEWSDAGAAYLFDVATLQQLHKLVPTSRVLGDEFGGAIDISNGKVAVGADQSEDNGAGSGSAFLFDAATGEQIHKFLPSDGAWADHFGMAVALQDGIFIGGADGADNIGQGSGAVYAFSYEAGGTSGIPDSSENLRNLVLHPNYPNPFNPGTTISYHLKNDGNVKLDVYSMRGQLVRTLVDGWQASGVNQTVFWNGQDALGKEMSSGVYYALLRGEGETAINKMVLLK